MSEILTKIEQDIITAMKAREADRLGVLRMLSNRIKMVAKNDGNREIVEQDVITGIQKSIKETAETREIYVTKGMATTEQDMEISILEGYLPKQMTEAEIRVLIEQVIADNQASEKPLAGKALMGPVMQKLKTEHSGAYDPRLASKIAGELIE